MHTSSLRGAVCGGRGCGLGEGGDDARGGGTVTPDEDDARAAAEVPRERLEDALPDAGGAAYKNGGRGVGLAEGGV